MFSRISVLMSPLRRGQSDLNGKVTMLTGVISEFTVMKIIVDCPRPR